VIVSHNDSDGLIRSRYHGVHLPATCGTYEPGAAVGITSGKRDVD
jgi:hypothetical protein